MPELPEVETIRRGLADRLVGTTIDHVDVLETRLRRPVDRNRLASLVGNRVRAVRRRAKYLLVDFEDESEVLLVHLGMSGRLFVRSPDCPVAKHEHVRFGTSDGAILAYHDPRRFGLVRVGLEELLPELQGLGPEPLSEEFDVATLWRGIRRSRRAIKNALLDQQLVAGIGNIYASEILYRAGVRPTRRGVRVRRTEAEAIVARTREVLTLAIEGRGTSFSDFVDAEGRRGSFQTLLAVFDREGEPCRSCGAPIVRLVHGGRSSFFCRRCQR